MILRLLLSYFLLGSAQLLAQSPVVEVPLEFHDGYGLFVPGYGGVSWNRGPDDNDWYKTYKPVKGIPNSWKDVKKGMIWIDANQFAYQNYRAGLLKADVYQYLKESWKMDTTKLSPRATRCFVYVATGTNSDGKQGVLVDTNHDLDFADERVVYPPTTMSIWKTGLPQQAIVSFPADFYRDGQVVTCPVKVLFALLDKNVLYNYPTYATATLHSGGETKSLMVASESFMNPVYESVVGAIVTTKHDSTHLLSSDDKIKQGEYITVGSDVFELDRVEYGRKLLRLKRVSKQDSLFSSQVGFRPYPFNAINLHTDKNLSLNDYKGRYVLLDFWGTWCAPCRAETPHLRMAYEQFSRSDLEIIGIGCNDTVEKIKAYCASENAQWPQILADDTNKLVDRYHISSWPTTILLDRDGKVVVKNLRGSQMMNILYQLTTRKP
jgi:thiol-disulfide isomerase/thioredoxin